jgi:hypothetical protein
MSHRPLGPILIAALLLGAMSPVPAQSVTSVRGRVVDCRVAVLAARPKQALPTESGRLFAKLVVSDDAGFSRTYRTDEDGTFAFLAPLAGNVHMVVTARGHADRVIDFEVTGADSIAVHAFMPNWPITVIRNPVPRTQTAFPATQTDFDRDEVLARNERCRAASAPAVDPDTEDRYTIH